MPNIENDMSIDQSEMLGPPIKPRAKPRSETTPELDSMFDAALKLLRDKVHGYQDELTGWINPGDAKLQAMKWLSKIEKLWAEVHEWPAIEFHQRQVEIYAKIDTLETEVEQERQEIFKKAGERERRS